MPTGSGESSSDLWWVDGGKKDYLLYVGHHLPITDDDEPHLTRWFHSLEGGRFCKRRVRHPAAFLQTWKDLCGNVNVYRSLQLFAPPGEDAGSVLGPFLIDIDNSEWDDDLGGFRENLQDALDVARRAVGVLNTGWALRNNDLRVFFSGRKGFNFEIRPSAPGIKGSAPEQLEKSWELQDRIRSELQAQGNFEGSAVGKEGTVIDSIYGSSRLGPKLNHPYTRLHGSINRWIGTTGDISRRRLEIQVPDLFSNDIPTMVGNSKV